MSWKVLLTVYFIPASRCHAFLSTGWIRRDVAGGAILDTYRKGDIYTTVVGYR